MAKIPFDIKLWPEIESGRYKVMTEHGEPVEIVKWDCKGKYPILAVINDGDTDDSCFYGPDGVSPSSKEKLFILTDEPEQLTEFEKTPLSSISDNEECYKSLCNLSKSLDSLIECMNERYAIIKQLKNLVNEGIQRIKK